MEATSPDNAELTTELLPLTHDRFFIETFQMKRLAQAFLRHWLPANLLDCLDLDGLTAEPRHITDELFKELIADVIYRVPIRGTENHVDFFVLLEHKSYSDVWTIFQLWAYVVHVSLQEFRKAKDEKRVNADYRLPPIIAIILHHGEAKFSGKTQLSELFAPLPGIEEYLPKLQAVLVDLNTIADDDVPNDPDAPELKLVLTSLKTVFRKDVSTKIKTILEELKPISDDPRMRRLIRMMWCYLVSSAKHMERKYEILFDTIKNIVEVETMPTMLEIWTAEAEAKGMERGMEKGMEKGEVKGKAEMVLAILRVKFEEIPEEIEETILQMTDPVSLDSLAAHVVNSQSLEEFVKALK